MTCFIAGCFIFLMIVMFYGIHVLDDIEMLRRGDLDPYEALPLALWWVNKFPK